MKEKRELQSGSLFLNTAELYGYEHEQARPLAAS